MDVHPFIHKHYLLYDDFGKQEASCDKCSRQINGWAFTCETCKFWLHPSCTAHKLPRKISHPLHSKLRRLIHERDFFCSKCSNLGRGYHYRNKSYSVKLDVICASSTDDQTLKEERERSKDIGTTIQHFCHEHSLLLFNYRKVRNFEYCCSWCEKPLSGMSYGCVQCSPSFFLHQFCLHTIPNKILDHPFHPSHPLYISFNFNTIICAACTKTITIYEYCYTCRECVFFVHVLCAKLKPTLRHECHSHNLTYIANTRGEVFSKCQKCKRDIGKKSSIYRCVRCNCNFHFECLVPSTISHIYHTHSLTLMTSFKEDGLGEYYCDICEEQRHPMHHAYCCKECKYVAHIECGLGKVAGAEFYQESTSSLKHEETQKKISGFSTHGEIKHFDHRHPLILKEAIEKNEKPLCKACEEVVCHQAYVCERGRCKYYLHKACAELSYELLYPLHSLDHPLILLNKSDSLFSKEFICEICREISRGFMYYCTQCNFKLDIKCVVGSTSNIVKQRPKETERPTNILHFIHNHEFLLVNCRRIGKRSFWCAACCLKISGLVYYCLQCQLYVHESCFGKLPREIQIPFHPQHTLLPFAKAWTFWPNCLACKTEGATFYYKCSQCDAYSHFLCASSLLQRPLSSKSHPHNLYLFPRDTLKLLQKYQSSKCEKCSYLLRRNSIYRCVECDINFHLQCVELSYRVKSKYHIHPLTLKDCFVEDDSGEYYCDICEGKRDPKNDVYYCEECDGQFTAHIECVAVEVEEVLQQYGPFPYSHPETWGDDVVEE